MNKYLQQKWDKTSYDLHRMKVRSSVYLSSVPDSKYLDRNLLFESLKYHINLPFHLLCKCILKCVLLSPLYLLWSSPKVKSAKPTINMTPPETYGHLALRLKKQKVALYFSFQLISPVVHRVAAVLKPVKPQSTEMKGRNHDKL